MPAGKPERWMSRMASARLTCMIWNLAIRFNRHAVDTLMSAGMPFFAGLSCFKLNL